MSKDVNSKGKVSHKGKKTLDEKRKTWKKG